MSRSAAHARPTALEPVSDAGSAILDTMYREHRHLAMLIAVLKEQLAAFNVGKTPHYALMLDVIEYMKGFPTRFEHPRRMLLCQKLLEHVGSDTSLEMLMAEKEQLIMEINEVHATLLILQRDNSLLKQEQLKVYGKALIENLERHIYQESNFILPRAQSMLTQDDWIAIETSSAENTADPLFGQRVEERYRVLSEYLAQSMKRAADDLTMVEFIGMGAIFDSIEPLSKGLDEIGGIVKSYAKTLWHKNSGCYRALIRDKQQRSLDYLSKPLDCLLDSYDCYVDGLIKVGEVLRKTREEIAEPYTSRIALVSDIPSSSKKTYPPAGQNAIKGASSRKSSSNGNA